MQVSIPPDYSNTNSIYNFTPNTIYIYMNNQTGTIGRAQYIDTQNGVPRFNLNGNIVNMPLNQNLFFNNTRNPNKSLPRKLRVDELVRGRRYVIFRNDDVRISLLPELSNTDTNTNRASFVSWDGRFGRTEDLGSSNLYNQRDLARIGINLIYQN